MLNTTILTGRLVGDPELRITGSGTHCASFKVACQRDYGDKETDFIPMVAWKQTADFVSKHFHKGDTICTVGRLQSRKYEDKTGAKRTAYEVVVSQCYFGGSKEKSADMPEDDSRRPSATENNFALLEDDNYQVPF